MLTMVVCCRAMCRWLSGTGLGVVIALVGTVPSSRRGQIGHNNRHGCVVLLGWLALWTASMVATVGVVGVGGRGSLGGRSQEWWGGM